MSLTEYYSDGSPLAYIPLSAAKVIKARHDATKSRCLCKICYFVIKEELKALNSSTITTTISSHSTRKRPRKYEYDQDDEDEDEDDDYYEEEEEEPQRKRQRIDENHNHNNNDRDYRYRMISEREQDDEVEAYSWDELKGLKVKELKQLLKDQHFPVSGNKSKLIDRLRFPEETIKEMKLSFYKKLPKGVRCHVSTPQWKVNELHAKYWKFNPEDYIFKDGKIKRINSPLW